MASRKRTTWVRSEAVPEQALPGVLRIVGDGVDEIDHPLFLRRGLDRLPRRADGFRL